MRYAEAGAKSITIGYAGENERLAIIFDVKNYVTEFPGCVITLMYRRPTANEAYPVPITVNGYKGAWIVSSGDTEYEGEGEGQLVITRESDGVVAKSAFYRIIVDRAIPIGEEVPEQWEPWITEMTAIKGQAIEAAGAAAGSASSAAQSEASAAGSATDAETSAVGAAASATAAASSASSASSSAASAAGSAGSASTSAANASTSATSAASSASSAASSASAAAGSAGSASESASSAASYAQAAETAASHYPKISETNDHWLVWDVTIGAYVDTGILAEGKDGQDGAPGAPGRDGEDGADGYSPTASVSKSGKTATITITDKTGTTTATVSDGEDGQPGQDGADGVSPAVTITETESGHNVTITDKAHPGGQTFAVDNGEKGDPGEKGEKGDPGERGQAGEKGETGKPGFYVTDENVTVPTDEGFITGYFTPTDPFPPEIGDLVYWTQDSGLYRVISRMADSVDVEFVRSLKGDKGDTGSQGSPGPQGIQGVRGLPGTSIYAGGSLPSVSGYNLGDIFVLLTDGGVYDLQDEPEVRWSYKGFSVKGAPGADGKSAYQSAQDGGYTGTEAQFNSGLAGIEGKYTKPSSGIPASDLASAVQTSLGKADNAIPKVLGDLGGHASVADSDYLIAAEAPDGDAGKLNVGALKLHITNGYRTAAEQDTIDSSKETKGKITISGVEKTADSHTVTIVTNGVTTNLTLVGVS